MNEELGFPFKLKSLRLNKGITQKELSINIGVGQTTIANYEQGIRFPDESNLKKIALFFKTSLDYLLGIKLDNIEIDSDTNNVYNNYLDYLLNYEFDEALKILLDSKMSTEKIFIEIFIPVLKELGKLWEQGKLTVANEHLISNQIERSISILSSKTEVLTYHKTNIVCLTTGSEMHNIFIQMLSELLRIKKFKSWNLGSVIPTNDIIDFLVKNQINILFISITLDININSAVNLIKTIREVKELKYCKIAIGGNSLTYFENPLKKLSADTYCKDIKECIDYVNLIDSLK